MVWYRNATGFSVSLTASIALEIGREGLWVTVWGRSQLRVRLPERCSAEHCVCWTDAVNNTHTSRLYLALHTHFC